MAQAKGITFEEFRKQYETEEACREELFRLRFPDGFVCPKCGCQEYYPIHTRNTYQCRNCRRQTSVTAGTVMHRTHLPLTNWFWAMYLCEQISGESRRILFPSQPQVPSPSDFSSPDSRYRYILCLADLSRYEYYFKIIFYGFKNMGDFFDIIDKPIFLHFLNREIRETEQARFEDLEIFEFIIIATLITQQYIYIGDAIVWESCCVFPQSIKLLRELEKYGLAYFIGTNDDIHSFLEKRRKLYQFDRDRYPVYFTDEITSMPWATNHRSFQTDTTAVLATDFFKIANDFLPESKKFSEEDKERINLSLEYRRRNNAAVTYSLFKKQNFSQSSILALKRQIITSYNQHYLNVMNGKIMTGIPGLQYYDSLQKSGLYFHFPFHYDICRKLGLLCKSSAPIEQTTLALLDVRMQKNNFKLLIQEIKKICAGIMQSAISPASFIARIHIQQSESLGSKAAQLWEISQLMCKENTLFKEGYYRMAEDKRKVLVLAASPLEYKILRQTAYEKGYRYVDKHDPNNEEFSYAECSESVDKKIFLAWTDMNSLHSAVAIQQLSNLLHPDYVIMGGICAGMRKDSQNIGEIIIADNIHDYNAAKETDTKRIMRGLTIESSRFLKEKFLIESYSSSLTASTGQLVSGNTLANSRAYVQKVLEDCPDAKGYEMEGTGLIHVCQSFQEKWMLVKAICDWGYDKTDSDQELAAKNSYSFIFDVIGKEW